MSTAQYAVLSFASVDLREQAFQKLRTVVVFSSGRRPSVGRALALVNLHPVRSKGIPKLSPDSNRAGAQGRAIQEVEPSRDMHPERYREFHASK